MEETSRFSLAVDRRAGGDQAEVLVEGRPLGLKLAGRVLERQYEVRSVPAALLLVTDDVPYEESLHLYLVDAGGRLLEERTLSAPYSPGVLSDVRVVSEDELAFSFQGSRWRLVVHRRPAGLLRRRRLDLHRVPAAPTP